MKCLVSFLSFLVILNLAIIQAVPTSKIIPKLLKNKTTNREDLIEKIKITEEIPEIEVEEIEEKQEVERAKKSATTTFCVEIRPEASKAPVLICDNQSPPSISIPEEPQISHKTHQQSSSFATPSNYVQESEDSVVINSPSNPEFFIPSEPYAPDNSYPNYFQFSQFLHQQPYPQNVISPSVVSNVYSEFSPLPHQNVIPALASNPYSQLFYHPSPCSSTSRSGLYLQSSQPVFHSLMMPSMSNEAFSFDEMGMRSIDGNIFAINSRPIIPLEIKVTQDFEPEIMEAPFVKKHVKDLYRIPATSLYPSNLYEYRYPYVVQNNPQLFSNDASTYILSAGKGRTSNGNFFDMNNIGQSMTPVDGHINMNMLQQAWHHVKQPMIQPHVSSGRGYQTHSIIPSEIQQRPYQSYQHSLDPYPISRHSAFPGNTVYSQQSNVVQPSISINSHPEILSPKNKNADNKNQEFEKKYLNRKAEKKETTNEKNKSEAVPTMTPSQILNEMRRKEFSGLNNRSTMQSFPRVNDNTLSNNGFAPNISSDSKPFMIAGAKRSTNDKTSKTDENSVEMEKTEAEKSYSEKKD